MAVRLRLTRFGRLNHPTYRLCAVEGSFKRDGRVIETFGYYLPKAVRADEQLSVDADRAKYWISVGALPSATVATLLTRCGVELPPRKKRAPRKRKPAAFTPPKRAGSGRKAKSKWRAKQAAASA